MLQQGHYPAHTLAPDPNQPELDLRPPDPRRVCLPIRASPMFVTSCPVCGGVHPTKADYQACVRDHDRQR